MDEIKDLVAKKIFKMPVWVWLLVVGAGGGIMYYRYRENQANAAAAQDTTADPNTAYGVSPYDQSSNSGDPGTDIGDSAGADDGYDSGFSEGLQQGLSGAYGGGTVTDPTGANATAPTVTPDPTGAGNSAPVINISAGRSTAAKKTPTAGQNHNTTKGKINGMTGGGHPKRTANQHLAPPVRRGIKSVGSTAVSSVKNDKPPVKEKATPKRKVRA